MSRAPTSKRGHPGVMATGGRKKKPGARFGCAFPPFSFLLPFFSIFPTPLLFVAKVVGGLERLAGNERGSCMMIWAAGHFEIKTFGLMFDSFAPSGCPWAASAASANGRHDLICFVLFPRVVPK